MDVNGSASEPAISSSSFIKFIDLDASGEVMI